MNAEVLKKAGIDYDRGVKRFLGKAQLYEKVLSKFPRDGAFARVRAAYAAEDYGQLLLDVHEFKGVCGNIALPALYETADAMVKLLRGGAYTREELSALYMRLEEEYHMANEAINAAMEAIL